jgi:hypothetical protein
MSGEEEQGREERRMKKSKGEKNDEGRRAKGEKSSARGEEEQIILRNSMRLFILTTRLMTYAILQKLTATACF